MPRDDDEREWLRFFLRRLRTALRYAKSPETTAILKELIAEIEARLEPNRKSQRLFNAGDCPNRRTAPLVPPAPPRIGQSGEP